MERSTRSSAFDCFESEKSRDFTKHLANLQSDHFRESDFIQWADKMLSETLGSITKNDLCENLSYDYRPFKAALLSSYLVHISDERKSGVPYLTHIEEVKNNLLNSLVEEKKLREKTALPNQKITSIQTVINSLIKGVLHDTREDFLKNTFKINLEKDESDNLLAVKMDFMKAFDEMLYASFDSEIVDSLMYVFTNFSQRVCTKNSLQEDNIDLSKEELGRIDFVIRALGTKKKEDWRITFSDKKHNTEDPQFMGKTKMIEFYNFAYLLLKIRNRSSAKSFLKGFFDFYLEERGETVKNTFKTMLEEKENADENCFKIYEEALRDDLDKLYGRENYALVYKRLGPLRVHEMIMQQYWKARKRTRSKQDKDPMGHYFVSEKIMQDLLFKEIFENTMTGRIVVKVKDSFKDFHSVRADGLSFNGFNIKSRIDYFSGEGNEELRSTGYQADSLVLEPKPEILHNIEVESLKQHFLRDKTALLNMDVLDVLADSAVKIKGWINKIFSSKENKTPSSQLLNVKILRDSDFYRNECGNNSYFDGNQESVSKIFGNVFKSLKDMLGDDNYLILKRISEEPYGINLKTKIQEIKGLENIDERLAKRELWEIFKDVSKEIKESLTLNSLLESGYLQDQI